MDDDDGFFTTTEAAAKARSSTRWLLGQADAPVLKLNQRKFLWPKRRFNEWLRARGLASSTAPSGNTVQSSGDTSQRA